MNKHDLSVPVTLSALVLALTACGSSDDSEPAPSSSASSPASPSRTATSTPTPEPTETAAPTVEPPPEPEPTTASEAAPSGPAPATGYTGDDHIAAGGGCFSDSFPLGEPSAATLADIQAFCATQDPADYVDEEAQAGSDAGGYRRIDAWDENGNPAAFTDYDANGNAIGAGVGGPPPEEPSQWVQDQLDWAEYTDSLTDEERIAQGINPRPTAEEEAEMEAYENGPTPYIQDETGEYVPNPEYQG